jgi:hypothetical protein
MHESGAPVAGEKGGCCEVSILTRGGTLPCRPPSNPQPSWRAAAHHLIRLNDLRLVPSGSNEPQLPVFLRET